MKNFTFDLIVILFWYLMMTDQDDCNVVDAVDIYSDIVQTQSPYGFHVLVYLPSLIQQQ